MVLIGFWSLRLLRLENNPWLERLMIILVLLAIALLGYLGFVEGPPTLDVGKKLIKLSIHILAALGYIVGAAYFLIQRKRAMT